METQVSCARPEFWNPHNHRCECGTVWFHDPAEIDDPIAHDKAHHCPSCGKEQWMTDSSGAVASVCYDGIKTKPFEAGVDCAETAEKKNRRMNMKFSSFLSMLSR